jgi:hypothetical protein
MQCPTARKIGIFDTSAVKFIKTIPTRGDNVLIAAGADKLLVVYPDDKLVERWSLTTFEKETEKKVDVKEVITAVAMGSATAGPLVLGGPKAQGNASKMALMFIDVETLKEVKIDKADGKFGVSLGNSAHLRISANGKLLSAWHKDVSPSGVQMAELNENSLQGNYAHENVGHVVPTADGKSVGTANGSFQFNLERTGMMNDAILPGVHKTGFLQITPPGAGGLRKVTVVGDGGMTLATYENLPSYDGKRDTFERDAHPLTLDQRITYIPDAKVIVVIPPAGNKLHVFKVGK